MAGQKPLNTCSVFLLTPEVNMKLAAPTTAAKDCDSKFHPQPPTSFSSPAAALQRDLPVTTVSPIHGQGHIAAIQARRTSKARSPVTKVLMTLPAS